MTTRSGARFRDNIIKKKRRFAKDDYAGRTTYNTTVPFLNMDNLSWVKVMNYLPVDTFVRLSRTCHEGHARCFGKLGHKITITEESVIVGQKNGQTEFKLWEAKVMKTSRVLFYTNDLEGHLETLRKIPCKVNLDHLNFSGGRDLSVTPELMAETRSFLDKFPVKKIGSVSMEKNIFDWRSVINLLMFYDVKKFSSRTFTELRTGPYRFTESAKHGVSESIMEALLSIEFTRFACSLSISEAFVVSRWIPDLFSFGTKVSRKSTELIVQKFISTSDLESYKIFGTMTREAFQNLWKNYRSYPEDYQGKVANERPLVFTDEFCRNEWNVECIQRTVLTQDNRVIEFEMMWNREEGEESDNCFIYFNHITNPYHWPDAIVKHRGINLNSGQSCNLATPAFYSFF